MSTDRSINAKVYASCRFDRKGHPPPECEFTVCAVYDGERRHLVVQSGAYPVHHNVIVRGHTSCDGYSCKPWYAVKHQPNLTHVKQLESETQQ